MPNSERGGSSEQHAKAGEQSHKNSSGSAQRNPGLKDRRAAVRTSSTSQQANRAIKIADYFRGRFVRPLSSPIRLSAPGP